VQNLWTFGTNPEEGATFWDRTVRNREFWVSTVVDVAVSVAVGVAAAAIVGAVVAATTPVWLAVAVTAGLGLVLGALVEASGLPDALKHSANALFH